MLDVADVQTGFGELVGKLLKHRSRRSDLNMIRRLPIMGKDATPRNPITYIRAGARNST